MEDQKTQTLAKYVGQKVLAKSELTSILDLFYPQAPTIEKQKAIALCASYGLNPLNNHVFLILFNRKNRQGEITGTDWSMVIGIKAKRLLASRRGPFSYIDGTPRVMTLTEQENTFGQSFTDRIYVITRLQDPATGATATGYGYWLKADSVKGESKGNTAFNMASIRSEAQALDRLRPGEMPTEVEVTDEQYVTGEFHEVKDSAGPAWSPDVVAANEPDETEIKLPESHHIKSNRDPKTVTQENFLKTCYDDFKIQPAEVFAELNIKTTREIQDPAMAYLTIAAVR